MREVVFEANSHLEFIGKSCFSSSRISEIAIPSSVVEIGNKAFYGCRNLSTLSFENGSQLSHVGELAFGETGLTPENVRYPDTLKEGEYGEEW